ncbi:hypothetical protein CVT24_009026 [Panaeolus cyanescens]|uniref:Uncharacterized protein n=1 Tax=Panaeolus cyanescens TaxID=181874 RepID=A0A409YAJ4_9AGAR|nr:hypothetical protein CVT24_009026 [Panaeolus cyanescens]
MLVFALVLCFRFSLGVALRNITVDDRDPLIKYFPSSEWIRIQDTLDADGGHMLTNFHLSEATLTFSFLNMYYMSTRWHYHVGAVIVVDGQEGVADMQDYSGGPDPDDKRAVIPSSVVWSYKGDGMKERTITVRVPPGDTLTVVDMFIFEVDDEPTSVVSTPALSPTSGASLASSSPSTTSSIATSSPPSTSSTVTGNTSSGLTPQTKALVISLSVVGAAFLALLLLFVFWFCVRKPSQKQEVEKSASLKLPDQPAAVDGKPQVSPRQSIGQASNSPSSDEEAVEPPSTVPAQQSSNTSTAAVIALPPERRPTIIARPVPSALHRNPTVISIQHGLDLPRVPERTQPDTPDVGQDIEPRMANEAA